MATEQKNIVPKAAPKEQRRTRQDLWRVRLQALFNPGQWSLRGRFVIFTGILLGAGVAFQALFMSSSLDRTMRNEAVAKLEHMEGLLAAEIGRTESLLLSQAIALAGLPEVQEGVRTRNREELARFILPYSEKIRQSIGDYSLHFGFHGLEGPCFLWTGNIHKQSLVGIGNEVVGQAMRIMGPSTGVVSGVGGLELRAVSPVLARGELVGGVETSLSMSSIVRDMVRPDAGAAVLLVPPDAAAGFNQDIHWEVVGDWALLGQGRDSELGYMRRAVVQGVIDGRQQEAFFRFVPLAGPGEEMLGGVLLGVDTTLGSQERKNEVYRLVGFFLLGALVLWSVLFFNTVRVENFLRHLRKVIIASHSNSFEERFETGHAHCLELMRCGNRECPVYRDPSLVCYLETGSMAISPKWRDTCVFLNKYEECRFCPVYLMRRGDELKEMRNVVNTMLRLWSNFLSRTGHLLATVLRSQETTGRLPSLDDVSEQLEHMGKLTSFGHDLQGTVTKEEVYAQLGHILENSLGVKRFVLFEVDSDGDRMLVAQDRTPDEPLCKREVLVSTEICRAGRVSEDVVSFWNPRLCPYFNCDHDRDVRCCLPMVMGGEVGAVLSFLTPRMTWESHVRQQLPIIGKYLAEAAPVLSSLKLLRLTKEQALRDALTHCHNRRFLDEFISKYEPLSLRDGRNSGFAMADLDYFKKVNDDLGHEAGDMVLKQIVAVIRRHIRKSDLLVRYGGEEFLILLQDMKEGAAEQVAEKIRAGVEGHVFHVGEGKTLRKTISLGVSEFPGDAESIWRAIKFADVALYEAKKMGRNRVVRFQPHMWTDEEF